MLRLVNVHNETSETGMSIIHTNEKTNQMYVHLSLTLWKESLNNDENNFIRVWTKPTITSHLKSLNTNIENPYIKYWKYMFWFGTDTKKWRGLMTRYLSVLLEKGVLVIPDHHDMA